MKKFSLKYLKSLFDMTNTSPTKYNASRYKTKGKRGSSGDKLSNRIKDHVNGEKVGKKGIGGATSPWGAAGETIRDIATARNKGRMMQRHAKS